MSDLFVGQVVFSRSHGLKGTVRKMSPKGRRVQVQFDGYSYLTSVPAADVGGNSMEIPIRHALWDKVERRFDHVFEYGIPSEWENRRLQALFDLMDDSLWKASE